LTYQPATIRSQKRPCNAVSSRRASPNWWLARQWVSRALGASCARCRRYTRWAVFGWSSSVAMT